MQSVVVGYSGGKASHWPTYKSIGDYTEAVRIEFDPSVITYRGVLNKYFDILSDDVFYPNFGSKQYRNALFVHNPEQQVNSYIIHAPSKLFYCFCATSFTPLRQQMVAQQVLEEVQQRKGGRKAYVDVEPATDFYRAEEYHQKYQEKSMAKWRG